MKRAFAAAAGVILVVLAVRALLMGRSAAPSDREMLWIIAGITSGIGVSLLYWSSRPRGVAPHEGLAGRLRWGGQLALLLLAIMLLGGSFIAMGIRSDRNEAARLECYVAWCTRPATWEGQSARRGVGLGTWYPFCDEHIKRSPMKRPLVAQAAPPAP